MVTAFLRVVEVVEDKAGLREVLGLSGRGGVGVRLVKHGKADIDTVL